MILYDLYRVDAVVVSSPTFTHEDIVIKALQARKAVFCEKPIAENRANTANCYEMAKKVGRPLFCAFNRRFDPSYSAVRDKVRKGEVGHVHMIKTVSRDSPLPTIDYLKASGGVFHDCMVHDIDMITWILGEYPDKVQPLHIFIRIVERMKKEVNILNASVISERQLDIFIYSHVMN